MTGTRLLDGILAASYFPPTGRREVSTVFTCQDAPLIFTSQQTKAGQRHYNCAFVTEYTSLFCSYPLPAITGVLVAQHFFPSPSVPPDWPAFLPQDVAGKPLGTFLSARPKGPMSVTRSNKITVANTKITQWTAKGDWRQAVQRHTHR
ncbi:hypothetical protein E2C01_072371 [Portunus trituberculatus]|uniref:Uncharacterized protein n=1 Tax=Portunus trituberculatus TaxID=210409 RepID=A0A5B7I2G1_PORTR|nr:hypothetical protein [Portunus trituberculatus]